MSEARHYKSILKDMVLYGIFGVTSQLATILLLPLFTRLLSPEEYGTLDLVLVSCGFVTIFMSLNVSSALYRYFYDESVLEKRQLISTLFLVVASLSIFLGMSLYVLTPQILKLTDKNELFIPYFQLGWISVSLIALVTFVSDVLRIERKIAKLGAVNFTLLLSQIGLSWVLVSHFHLGISGILISTVLSNIFALAVGLVLIRHQLRISFSQEYLRKALSYSLPLIPSIFTNWINQRSTRFIVLSFLGLKAVGIYGIGALLASAMSFLVSTFGNAWSAYIMTIFRDGAIETIHRRALTFFLGGCFSVGIAYLTVAKEICLYVLDPKYLEALSLLPWIMGGIILHSTSEITGFGITVSKKTGKYSVAAWIGAAFNLALSFALVPFIGSLGAAIGFFCAEGIFTLILMKYTYRLHSLRFDLKNVALLISIYIAASSVLTWFIMNSDGTWLRYTVGLVSILLLLSRLDIYQLLGPFVKNRFRVKVWANN